MNITELIRQTFGATDEQLAAFAEAMKTNGIYTAAEENLDIRYGKLKTDYDAVVKERDTGNTTIEQLQKAAKGQENLQKIISDHEQTIKNLTEELNRTKIDSAIRVGLLAENVKDVDYLTYKLNEKLRGDNETLALDENGAIKGWADKLAGLKTQFPTMFEASGDGENGGMQVVDPIPLRKGGDADKITPAALRAMDYDKRVKFKRENESAYRTLKNSI